MKTYYYKLTELNNTLTSPGLEKPIAVDVFRWTRKSELMCLKLELLKTNYLFNIIDEVPINHLIPNGISKTFVVIIKLTLVIWSQSQIFCSSRVFGTSWDRVACLNLRSANVKLNWFLCENIYNIIINNYNHNRINSGLHITVR